MTGIPPELLSPAGSPESLRAALAGGADAVYFGGPSFSNRMRARNFTDAELSDAIKLCHDCGAKAYITVNTRIRDCEIDEALRLCEVIAGGDEKCDAIIMADLGLASAVKREFPHALLHASTQTSLMSPADCEELAKLGFTRLVVPREMSADEIAALCERCAEIGFETEMFVHGAHCVSCSGQCLMSFIMGGRSGNRGECAQPCRLPYRLNGGAGVNTSGYPLSLADMCLADRITDVIGSGVTSLKIEGRLKSAPYVYGVTKIYRTLLDERRNATYDEIKSLASLFSRGFTDGYFTKKYFSMADKNPMSADKSANKSVSSHIFLSKEISRSVGIRISETRDRRLAGEGATPLSAEFVLEAGKPSEFTLILGDIRAAANGDIPQTASGRPTDSDSAAKNLTKFGGTGYCLSKNDIKFTIGSGLWLPASSLNELRRRAADALNVKLELKSKTSPAKSEKSEDNHGTIPVRSDERGARIAMICEGGVFRGSEEEVQSLLSRFARVYVPRKLMKKAARLLSPEKKGAVGIGLTMPIYTPYDEEVNEILADAKKYGISRVLCHTVGQVKLARESGMIPDASFRTNVTNSYAADCYRSLGCASVMLSPEAAGGAYRKIGGGAVVYGRLPLMALSRCVICGGKCRRGNAGGRLVYPFSYKENECGHECAAELVDRIGEVFPVMGQDDCVNVVYNSKVNWMGDCIGQISGAEQYWFLFTDESASDAADVMDRFDKGRPLNTDVRRI